MDTLTTRCNCVGFCHCEGKGVNVDTMKNIENLLRNAYLARNKAQEPKYREHRERLLSLASAWQFSAMELVALSDGMEVA